jgi:hypothetical protein
MKALFGTDQACSRPAERADADQMVSEVESKIASLERSTDRLRRLPARSLDEAMHQIFPPGRGE